jgi:hypothetical protein
LRTISRQNHKTDTTPQLYCTLSTYVKTKNYFPPEPKNLTQCHNCIVLELRTKTYFPPEPKSDTTAQLEKAWIEEILRLFTIFYLHRKFSKLLRNDRDCKPVEAPDIFEKLS